MDMSCCCKLCKKKGHEKDHGTYHCVPLKEKEECMIGIPPDDGEDVEFGSNGADQTAGVDDEIVTPRMDVENETESPWSIHSPEAKRLKKIREEKRLGEFNKKMDQHLEERGLMLDLDKVKLNGIQPRRLKTADLRVNTGLNQDSSALTLRMPTGLRMHARARNIQISAHSKACSNKAFILTLFPL